MLVLRHLERIGRRFRAPVLTLGTFDGVHCGHQAILRRATAVAQAGNGTALALTFWPHPVAVLAPDRAPLQISDWRARLELIAAMGIEGIIVQRFTRAFSDISADEFVRRLLVDNLAVQHIVVGHRVSFGHNRTGGAALLRQLGDQHGFGVDVIGPVQVDGGEVSSSAIRRAISSGELRRARAMLGRLPSVAGRVIHGHHRGRQLGFPTANLRIRGLVLPPDGVYAVRVTVRGWQYDAIANLGFNPTFQGHARGLETHLFDFDADLYGARIEVSFVERLRGEAKFADMDALAKQIARDCQHARDVLAVTPP